MFDLAKEGASLCKNLRGVKSNKYGNIRSALLRFMAEYLRLDCIPNLAMEQCSNCFHWDHRAEDCKEIFRCHNW